MKLNPPSYTAEFILRCLHSQNETLALWGAIQRLKGLENASQLVELLELPVPLIQEAALSTLAAFDSEEAQGLVPYAVTIFRESSNQLKYQAAYCLSRFPSDFTNSLLSKWAKSCLESEHTTRFELEAAILSWLGVDPKATDTLLERLVRYQENPLYSTILFRHLLPHCQDPERFSQLMDFYFYTRDHHADLENTKLLIEWLVDPEVMPWIAQSTLRGNSLEESFSQVCSLLMDAPEMRWREYWQEMDQAGIRFDSLTPEVPAEPRRLIKGVKGWLSELEPSPSHPVATWLVEGFDRNLEHFGSAIPRMVEMEVQALLALVPSLLIQQSVDNWLLKPEQSLENIANFYHSPISSAQNQDRILRFFFPQAPDWSKDQCKITGVVNSVSLSASKAEMLWRFFRGEFLGAMVPWPSLFPSPGANPRFSAGLAQIYLVNFASWVEAKDHVSLDYALQLFQIHPSTAAQDLLLRHFDFLQRHHAELFYQVVELLPDVRIIEPLEQIYRAGEYDLAGLIAFLCYAFERPIPAGVQADLENRAHLNHIGRKKPVRLKCEDCGHSYQYFAEVIYVDEGDIMRTGRLLPQSLWTPNPFHCKGCRAELALELDEAQLEELTLQSKTDRILRQSSKQSGLGQRIMLVEFPRHHGQSFNPDQFEAFVQENESSQLLAADELQLLYLKAARMYKGLSRYHEALTSLAKMAPVAAQYQLESLFLKGVCYFRIGDYVQARPCFDEVLQYYGDQVEQPFLEESKSFLKSMSENRQRFLVIEGRK